MREQISLMLQKNAVTEVPPNSQNFTQHIPDTQSFRRVASSNRFKKSERSHFCTSFSYVHYKLSSEYHAKRRLRVQDRPVGCVLSCTNSSKQQEVSQVCLRKQGLSVSGTPLWSEHSPSEFYLLGAHRLGISVIPYLDNWLVHHPDRQVF